VGNAVLAARGTPEPTGVSADLVEAGKTGDWDIAFVALDPKRAAEIAQSPPYVQIEGAYLVRSSSKLTANEQVDAKGHRIVVGRNSAYDLYLTRELKQAELVRTPTSNLVTDTFIQENYEAAAGVKQQLEADARRVPGVRLLPGRFMVINQAMASRRIEGARGVAGARYVREFVEDVKASGFVAKALERHKQTAAVAPPGDPK
jgi:polar amino acid transport system substrate-binding protein